MDAPAPRRPNKPMPSFLSPARRGGLPQMATPSPARHDAAFTMMSLLNVTHVDPLTPGPRDPMSPPQIRVAKRTRGGAKPSNRPRKTRRMPQPPAVDPSSEKPLARRVTTAVEAGSGTSAADVMLITVDPSGRPVPGSGRGSGRPSSAKRRGGRASKSKAKSASEYNRKDKSLGLLCERFLAFYGTGEHLDVCLDIAAGQLGVERRRIYDIVNILESVHIVQRSSKNKYAWCGTAHLQNTLDSLAALGASHEGLVEALGAQAREIAAAPEQTSRMNPERMSRTQKLLDAHRAHRSATGTPSPSSATSFHNARRERSLGGLSEKFVQIFLLGMETCTLEQAARMLLGDACDDSKLKTKVRRLYDIANVLCSLQLIEKVYHSRKPAFQWRGASGVPHLPALVQPQDVTTIHRRNQRPTTARRRGGRRTRTSSGAASAATPSPTGAATPTTSSSRRASSLARSSSVGSGSGAGAGVGASGASGTSAIMADTPMPALAAGVLPCAPRALQGPLRASVDSPLARVPGVMSGTPTPAATAPSMQTPNMVTPTGPSSVLDSGLRAPAMSTLSRASEGGDSPLLPTPLDGVTPPPHMQESAKQMAMQEVARKLPMTVAEPPVGRVTVA